MLARVDVVECSKCNSATLGCRETSGSAMSDADATISSCPLDPAFLQLLGARSDVHRRCSLRVRVIMNVAGSLVATWLLRYRPCQASSKGLQLLHLGKEPPYPSQIEMVTAQYTCWCHF